MSVNANKITCGNCGRKFYYESDCLIRNHKKNYAIITAPSLTAPEPAKAAIFDILNMGCFKLRLVREFIFLSEKTRIFEAELDDRVIEVIKYTYISVPNKLGTDAKIILNGVDDGHFVFTLYDENDIPITTYRTSIETYWEMHKQLPPESVDRPFRDWSEINLKWAQKHTEGKI